MSCLDDIKKCIHKSALIEGKERNFLEEKGTNTKVQINAEGQYLLYDFEKVRQPLFPFFERTEAVKGLNAIADKIIFTEDGSGNVWIFIVELKQGKVDPQPQIRATKQFMMYIMDSINRVCRTHYSHQIRGLGYSKIFRPPTKIKKPYNNHMIAFFTGEKLNLSFYKV